MRSGGMPMPWSEIASTKPVAVIAPDTTTAASGGENDVAFSSSSASEVRDVGDRASRHREVVVDADELDAWEVGDLGRGGAHDVEQRDRLLPLARLLGARQHEEALRVAAHAGRHVVELEQRVERGGVVLVALELVEQLELALEQALVAAGQVHEQVAHALAQQARLLLRDLDGHRLDVVERLGELADLVLRRAPRCASARIVARRRRRRAATRPAAGAGVCDISRARVGEPAQRARRPPGPRTR